MKAPNPPDEKPGTRGPLRGRLRVFLGYAAGVGKTYAMLEAARQRLEEGVEVVAGHVQTFGQPETETLLEGIEIIPSFPENGGAVLDIEAILRRRPQLVLVDELAAPNRPHSRHPKRYQDVEELLNAGIDVYTAVNIQHIESLNDVVEQITGVKITETVPDWILDRADQIELIDLPPEDLLKRLAEGKVHLPDHARADSRKLFRQGNLTALRELAMRQAARRVDEQMRAYMQNRAIPGPWPAGERLMVCIGPSPLSARLVRTACRLAQELNAEWEAVYVEGSGHMHMDEASRERLVQTMRLAEELGAAVTTVPGDSVADAVLQYARAHNVTKIIIGHPLRSRWIELLRVSIVNRLVQRSGNIDVYVISSGQPEAQTSSVARRFRRVSWMPYLAALLLILCATLVSFLVQPPVSPTNQVMFYLLAVVLAAVRLGYIPAVLTAILSVIVFDFFFVPPTFSFWVLNAQYLLTFAGLFGVGFVIANLTARLQAQVEAARRREAQTSQLYSLSRDLATTVSLEAIIRTLAQHVSHTFHCEAGVFLASNGPLAPAVLTPGYVFDEKEQAAAEWAYRQGRRAGSGTDTLPTARALYLPLKTAQQTIGVLGVILASASLATPEQRRLLDAFANQGALAVEAANLAQQAQQAQLLQEREKLQTILLNSISHDLRTPLVSITGALSSLRDDAMRLDEVARRELIEGAWQEADRLNRLVGNLLEMNRLESGNVRLKREPYDIQEIIGVARAQLSERLRQRQLVIDMPVDLPLVPVDFTLMTQVLVNLLDNAAKYSPEDQPIEIRTRIHEGFMVLEVVDRGVGIPEDELPHIFEKFYRAASVSGVGGTGLGLSICQGIVEAHGGTIQAANRPGGGAIFTLMLPLEQLVIS